MEGAEAEGNVEFKWGRKLGVGGRNKNFTFYESFTLRGVEFSLYDCAYFYRLGDVETFIGKLMRIYETPKRERKVGVVWFFRPVEIRLFLGDYKPQWNELFLACGDGVGLFNRNDVEAIVGKCNVLCVSNDPRNPQPADEELREATYVFSYGFNVGSYRITDDFADNIAGFKVESFFNKPKRKKPICTPMSLANGGGFMGKCLSSDSEPLRTPNYNERIKNFSSIAGREAKEPKDVAVPSCKRIVKWNTMSSPEYSYKKDDVGPQSSSACRVEHRAEVVSPLSTSRSLHAPKRRRLLFKQTDLSDDDEAVPQIGERSGARTDVASLEVANTPSAPYEERLKEAKNAGTVVVFENLDPSWTSSEVEELIWRALIEKVSVKMIQQTAFLSPHYGKALAIFNTKDAADSVISQLGRHCLVLEGGRPLICHRRALTDSEKPGSFVGHLVLDKLRIQVQKGDMREAVSTSHCSQPETMEYDMAMEWRALQAKSEMYWKKLHGKQAEDRHMVESQLRMNRRTETGTVCKTQ